MKQNNKKADLGTLGASLLGNLLTDNSTIRPGEDKITASEGTIKTGKVFQYFLISWQILKYKNIIKSDLKLMVFIQGINYLK